MSRNSKNVPLDICAERKLRSACVFAQSDQGNRIGGVFSVSKSPGHTIFVSSSPEQDSG